MKVVEGFKCNQDDFKMLYSTRVLVFVELTILDLDLVYFGLKIKIKILEGKILDVAIL